MQLPLSAAAIAEALGTLEYRTECGSTNTELVALSATRTLPDFTVLATTSQTAGRGRLGRVWVAPPGQTLAISVFLRPELSSEVPLPIAAFGWLPLIAGLAMTRAVAGLVPTHSVALKWPNDVQIDGLKVSGLLAELVPKRDAGPARRKWGVAGAGVGEGAGVVMGAGVNLFIPRGLLPTATSTSLVLNDPILDGDALVDATLSRYLTELRSLTTGFLRAGADPARSGIAAMMAQSCSTIGHRVRVELPAGDDLLGTATGIDDTGRLMVADEANGAISAVAAGDVTHLRHQHGV